MATESSSGVRRKPHILFLGANNIHRTLMAEAYLRKLGSDIIDVKSAGLASERTDPRTMEVLREDGIDLGHPSPALINSDLLTWADLIITIAAHDERLNAPIPNGAREKQWTIASPLDPEEGEDELDAFRRVRNDVKRRVQQLVNSMRLSAR
ncbi:MAG TPA: hypothetical protein ENN42_01495 [Thioalkalivibrio sp.]|nr:hypothetical protein [Thioalkalivibrio sp.]